MLEFKLTDTQSENRSYVTGHVEVSEIGIAIHIDGYGEKTSLPEHSYPIFIEYHEGKLKVILWSDINEENYTHNVSMEGAREENYHGN